MKIVIIGSGLTGSTLANLLCHDHEVTVIEKGPSKKIQLPKDFGWDTKLANVPTFCFGQGGTTNLWHNGLIFPDVNPEDPVFSKIRHDSLDFIQRAASSLNYKESDSFFDRTKKVSADFLELENSELYYPYVYSSLELDDRVNPYFEVDDFIIDCKLSTIILSDGERISYDRLVFCAGGLSTPQIVKNKLGYPIDNYFSDHPMGFFGKIKVKKEYSKLFFKAHQEKLKNGYKKTAILIDFEGSTSAFYLRPAGNIHNSVKISKYKSELGASNGMRRIMKLFDKRILNLDIIEEIINKFFKVRLFSRYYSLMVVGDQRIRSNVLGDNFAELIIDESDLKKFKKQFQILESKLEPYCEEINIVTEINPKFFWSSAHHSNSLPCRDYVDENMKLKGSKNIYICDSSIISDHKYFNTGLLLSSMAHLLASKFLEKDK